MGNLYEGTKIRLTAKYPGDNDAMARWYEDADFARQMDTDTAFPQTAEALAKMDEPGPGRFPFIIRPMGGDAVLGFVALFGIEWNNRTASLAIGVGPAANRGKGYGSEALALVLRYAFCELNLHRVGLTVIGSNRRALAVYRKAGFTEEGRVREFVDRDGQRCDLVYMGILRREWKQMQDKDRRLTTT